MSDNASDDVCQLIKLRNQAAHLMINSDEGVPLVRLGLITTLYFKNGHTAQAKLRIAECFSRFRHAFKRELRWQFHRTLFRLNDGNFGYRRKLVRTSSVDEQLIWAISSGTLQEVAGYRMFVMNVPDGLADIDCSCLKMVLPWSILLSPDGPRRYEEWLNYLCGQLNADHGFGGLACILPHDGQHCFALEQRLAQRYIGLMVDPMPQIESLRLLNHIKGANWYTVLGQRFVKQLGGNDAVRRQLSGCREVEFQTYDDGLIIRAGALPVLGGDAQDSLAAYVEVNRVIRPIRVSGGCLHPFLVNGGGGFCEASSAQWYARFDDKPVPPLFAGQACTRDGYWFNSSAAGSRCVFRTGEIMPTLGPSNGKRTQWFWLKATH
ncbi:type VI immunity family protein [Pseudomonas sp. NA-150]|uniref:type VI immunity family protein n=1 Tax=Pseudomonas sp. NA-150 TaxID=3367525 RepID=UPI0037C8F25A